MPKKQRNTHLLKYEVIWTNFNASIAGTDSGVYSSPNSPDTRAARKPSYKPTYKRPSNPSRAESQESSRKTSNGSFCDTINNLLAFPSCEVRMQNSR